MLDNAVCHWIVLYTVHFTAFSLGGGAFFRTQCTIQYQSMGPSQTVSDSGNQLTFKGYGIRQRRETLRNGLSSVTQILCNYYTVELFMLLAGGCLCSEVVVAVAASCCSASTSTQNDGCAWPTEATVPRFAQVVIVISVPQWRQTTKHESWNGSVLSCSRHVHVRAVVTKSTVSAQTGTWCWDAWLRQIRNHSSQRDHWS